MSDFFEGCSYILRGAKLLATPGLRLFVLVPLLVNTLIFGLLILWVKSLFSGWMVTMMAWLPDWLSFLQWLFWAVYGFMIIMVLFYSFVSIANLIAAPFYGYLAEVAEQRITGAERSENSGLIEIVKIMPRTLARELAKLWYYTPRLIGITILGLIPGLNLLAVVLGVMFSGWMMAIQFIDYPADNNQMIFADMKTYIRRHRIAAFAYGLCIFGLTLVPFLNLVIFPAAVCGAVIFWVERQPLAIESRFLTTERLES